MRNVFLTFLFAALAHAADNRPRVRAITAFVEVDRAHPTAAIDDAQKFLTTAREAVTKAGFEVGGMRVTTQPFPMYTKGLDREHALTMLHQIGDAAGKDKLLLCIGPAMFHDSDDTANVDVLIDFIAHSDASGNLVIADEQGIHWKAIPQAAKAIKAISEGSPHGDANRSFSALAMIPPYGPFYPSSYHLGKGHMFTLALEGANVVQEVFSQSKNPAEAEPQLTTAFARYGKELETAAMAVSKSTGWKYQGIDLTPAPQRERSIGAAIESFTRAPFGSSQTLTVTGMITRAILATPIKHAGTSGPMLPVMEDPTMSKRWAEGTYNLASLLAYSAVGANGLETVPLPGDITQEQIAHILSDVATVAFKDKTPMSARLLPSPGRKAGEKSEFTGYLINTTLQPLPGGTR
ncbi:MAG TPA: DUF711 family protein [Bryobacteraceae bacterium]|nr:DUF711 family protein [Bryobacteraceae bacterium]